MKKLLIVNILFLSINIYSQPQWVRIDSPTNNLLRKIVFADSLNGWACGLNGTIIHTSDGGDSWFIQNTNTSDPVIDIHFIDNQKGWALTWELNNPPLGTYMLKTTDGGINWIKEFIPIETEFFRSVFFLNEQFGLIGDRFTYYTTNGGAEWNLSQRDSDLVANLPFHQIKMLNDLLGFACGGVLDNAGIIWKTTDSGRNWKTNAISPDEIFEIFIFDSQNILALSGDPEYLYGVGLIKSSDGGETWSYEELPINAVCFGIDFRNELEGWSAAGYKMLFTNDGGNSWSEMDTPDSSAVYDVQFVNDRKGFACGQDGVLIKYIPDPNRVEQATLSNEIDYKLFQNYPNPFNPVTSIQYAIGSRQFVQLKVYDLLGNEVATLVDEEKPAGQYKVEFNANQISKPGISSGVYFYRFKLINSSIASEKVTIETKKMIYLK
ncbi:MAG: T9SS type A sorting domain-containing protein [Ignavibacterium sp.]|jgi:photosystem II stability/assembly factor-like uncharacterized protein|uniref:YCF48-related protein n=1 Tax=Ignavibacterium sp. TaxID=2651167 RepID=UPI00329719AE